MVHCDKYPVLFKSWWQYSIGFLFHSQVVVVIMKRIIVAILAAIVSTWAFAAQNSVSTPDPFAVPDADQIYPICNGNWQCNAPFRDHGARTPLANQTVNTGIANLVLFVMGQSNNVNEAPTPYTATNASAISDFDYNDGTLYPAADAHFGCTSQVGTTGTGLMDYRVADTLITNGKFARVIIVCLAIGGTNILQWSNGGVIQNLPCVAMKRLAARGITPQTNVTFFADWGQGEAESSLSTTQLAYTTALDQIATNLSNCGFVGRMMVNVETWGGGVVYAPVQAAQAAVAGTTFGNVNIIAGANLDSLNNANRVDTTHFNDTGSTNGAALKVTATHASGAPF
jgi:hypothetical protein